MRIPRIAASKNWHKSIRINFPRSSIQYFYYFLFWGGRQLSFEMSHIFIHMVGALHKKHCSANRSSDYKLRPSQQQPLSKTLLSFNQLSCCHADHPSQAIAQEGGRTIPQARYGQPSLAGPPSKTGNFLEELFVVGRVEKQCNGTFSTCISCRREREDWSSPVENSDRHINIVEL